MRKTYNVQIDCANCANKLEARLSKIPEIQSISINFMTQKMIVDYMDGTDTISIEQKIRKIGQRVDADFLMY